MYGGSNVINKCRLLTESCMVQQINPTTLNEVGLRYGLVDGFGMAWLVGVRKNAPV